MMSSSLLGEALNDLATWCSVSRSIVMIHMAPVHGAFQNLVQLKVFVPCRTRSRTMLSSALRKWWLQWYCKGASVYDSLHGYESSIQLNTQSSVPCTGSRAMFSSTFVRLAARCVGSAIAFSSSTTSHFRVCCRGSSTLFSPQSSASWFNIWENHGLLSALPTWIDSLASALLKTISRSYM